MPTPPEYPRRLRLHGGRNSHAARPVNGDPDNLVTACGYLAGLRDHVLPNDLAVTCRNCAREVTR